MRFPELMNSDEGKAFPYAPIGYSALLLLLPYCLQGRAGQCGATLSLGYVDYVGFFGSSDLHKTPSDAIFKVEIEMVVGTDSHALKCG